MKCIEQKTYKETTIMFIGNGTMLQSNNDIEITEDIRLALATIIKKAHDDRIDRIVDDISRRCKIGKRKSFWK